MCLFYSCFFFRATYFIPAETKPNLTLLTPKQTCKILPAISHPHRKAISHLTYTLGERKSTKTNNLVRGLPSADIKPQSQTFSPIPMVLDLIDAIMDAAADMKNSFTSKVNYWPEQLSSLRRHPAALDLLHPPLTLIHHRLSLCPCISLPYVNQLLRAPTPQSSKPPLPSFLLFLVALLSLPCRGRNL